MPGVEPVPLPLLPAGLPLLPGLEPDPELPPEEPSEPTIDSMVDAAWASRAARDSGLKLALSLDPPEVVEVVEVADEVEAVDPVDWAAARSAAKLF